jgi:hypothetical protein
METNNFDLETMSFIFDGTAIQNPTASPCGRFTVDPKGYGFYVEHTGGGCTAWVKKLDNGYLVMTNDNLGHDLGRDGTEFTMCFYDGDEEQDSWGTTVACFQLYVGVVPEESVTRNGAVVDYATVCKIIKEFNQQLDIKIDRADALLLVDIFKNIDLANT